MAAPALLSLKPLVDRLDEACQLRAYSGYVPKVCSNRGNGLRIPA